MARRPPIPQRPVVKPTPARLKEVDALFQQGQALHRQGQLAQARQAYQQVLALAPQHVEAAHMLGVAFYSGGDHAQAIACYERALARDANHAALWTNLGVALKKIGRFDEALTCFDKAIAIQPALVQAHNNRGNVLLELQQFEASLVSFVRAIELRPDYVEAYYNLGNALQALQRFDQALVCYDKTIALRPDYAEAHNNRGIALKELDRLDEAVASYDRALALKPDHAETHNNYGNVLTVLDRAQEALACYDRAIALRPNYAEAYYNRGTALKTLGHLEASIACFDQAIQLQPDYAEALWNKSFMLLLSGDFAQGWPLYEWRWKNSKTRLVPRRFAQPLWLGDASLAGRTILLHAEQGLGDSIQFGRFASHVRALGAKVLLEVPAALIGLFEGLDGVDVLLAKGQPLPDFDCHCPLLSLPLALKTDLDNIPSPHAYLSSQADKREAWAERLGPKTRPRVGLVWRGSVEHTNDRHRSLSLADLMPHLPDHCEYVSLQKEIREVDRSALESSAIRHYGDLLHDFTDTAALCDAMDLVVSVDTSVAHLAGALGKPTWLLLPHVPDWRWLMHREDSPWYASMRLYRQADDRRWLPVLQRVAADLRALA